MKDYEAIKAKMLADRAKRNEAFDEGLDLAYELKPLPYYKNDKKHTDFSQCALYLNEAAQFARLAADNYEYAGEDERDACRSVLSEQLAGLLVATVTMLDYLDYSSRAINALVYAENAMNRLRAQEQAERLLKVAFEEEEEE